MKNKIQRYCNVRALFTEIANALQNAKIKEDHDTLEVGLRIDELGESLMFFYDFGSIQIKVMENDAITVMTTELNALRQQIQYKIDSFIKTVRKKNNDRS